jgi:ABC-2 type transport system ATP-binding protein
VIVAELNAATKRFGALTALDRVSVAIGQGDVLALLGPNGAGKTTAIACLLGLRVPDGGSARLFGRDPRLVGARRRIGVAPQETAFPPTLRVQEVIELVRRHYEQPTTLEVMAARFGLQSLLRRQLGGLSGGERRLVAIVLAFAGAPELVVLDEPTAGLDAEARNAVWEAVRAHARAGGTVLLTTHHLDEVEALAERVVLLERGVVVEDGTVAEIKRAAGLTRVSFRAPPGFAPDGIQLEGRLARADVEDAGTFVAALVHRGVRLAELEVRPLSLEEAIAPRRRSR